VKTYKLRELKKKLKKHSKDFDFQENRGKGGHSLIYHPNINGRSASYPLPSLTGGDDVLQSYYKHIARRFDLPDDFFA